MHSAVQGETEATWSATVWATFFSASAVLYLKTSSKEPVEEFSQEGLQ